MISLQVDDFSTTHRLAIPFDGPHQPFGYFGLGITADAVRLQLPLKDASEGVKESQVRQQPDVWSHPVWPGGVEHGPDDLASIGGGQNPEGAGENGDDREPSPVRVKVRVVLTLQVRTVVSNGQA